MRRNAVKEALQATGMSYTELGEKLKVTRQTIHRWASENRIPVKYIDVLMASTDKVVHTKENSKGEMIDIRVKDQVEPDTFKIPDIAPPDFMSGELEFLSTEDLVRELQRRGWSVTLTELKDSGPNGEREDN